MDTVKTKRPKLTPTTLFEFARDFSRPHGSNWDCPTLKEAAKHFGVAMIRIEEACLDYQGDGYLGIAVGIGGNGGAGRIGQRSRHLVEAYDPK